MTEQTDGWYHCGRCGHLFEESEDGRCPVCGQNPVVSDSEMAYHMALSAPAEAEGAGRVEKTAAQAKDSGGLLKFTVAWVGFLSVIAGIIALARLFSSNEDTQATIDIGESSESMRELNDAYTRCYPLLRGYYSSVAPEIRAPLTLHPTRSLERMSRWPEELVLIDRNTLVRNRSFTVFGTSEGQSAGSLWELENGDRLEAVFRHNEEGAWAIDWEQMVRYSTETWPVFVSGLGDESGEFRLLARRRASASLGVGDVSRIILHQPSTRRPGEFGPASPEVQVDPSSEDGVKLAEAFELRDAGGSPFNAGLTQDDPLGMIRVRVRLHLGPKDENGRLTLILDKVVACHWMDIDDRGRPEPKKQ
ncbi:zinc ribbon domain-containing protein [Haloferula sargassicola]|uniref:Rubredoxin-like domain-containing protein n=1 Tax=Haloferula sargassicola TaxID=490096 RepID=A0ABP9UXP9_9BACT